MESAIRLQACQPSIPLNQFQKESLLRLGQLRLTLAYPGWQDDFLQAESAVLTDPQELEDAWEDVHFFRLTEKQRMFVGDRRHPRLVLLDSLVFSYPGWELDMRQVEEAHVLQKSSCCFDQALQLMINRENVHKGDRSHPKLVQLDRLKEALTYPGWEKDFIVAEKCHLSCSDEVMQHYIFKLIEKQRMHYGDRSHSRLRKLDSFAFDYPGFEQDKKIAEEEHVVHKQSPWFDHILEGMKERQRLHDETRSNKKSAKEVTTTTAITSLENETETSESNRPECAICMSNAKSHAFLPCGHLCACETCAYETLERTAVCPICRDVSESVAQIFIS